MKPEDVKMSRTGRILIILIVIGFACMEFPGVFLFMDRVEPYIFGMPFIYGWNVLCWLYLCIVLAVAAYLDWGGLK